jgi:hypothetical protein
MGRVPSGLDPRRCTFVRQRVSEPVSSGQRQSPLVGECLQLLSRSAQTSAGEAFAAKNCVTSATCFGREPNRVALGSVAFGDALGHCEVSLGWCALAEYASSGGPSVPPLHTR